MSQNELAQELGTSFATVNRWENGHSMPNKERLPPSAATAVILEEAFTWERIRINR